MESIDKVLADYLTPEQMKRREFRLRMREIEEDFKERELKRKINAPLTIEERILRGHYFPAPIVRE